MKIRENTAKYTRWNTRGEKSDLELRDPEAAAQRLLWIFCKLILTSKMPLVLPLRDQLA